MLVAGYIFGSSFIDFRIKIRIQSTYIPVDSDPADEWDLDRINLGHSDTGGSKTNVNCIRLINWTHWMSKKFCPFLCRELLYQNGQAFLDT